MNCKRGAGDNLDNSILVSVININVEYIRGFNHLPGLIPFFEFPYDTFIVKIIWELTDNPAAAHAMVIEAVEELVALLEAASLYEGKFGHHTRKKRLVYTSMKCLLDCARALRLSSSGLLTADAHRFRLANQCLSPSLDHLSLDVPLYVTTLTSALFSDRNRKHNNWLLAFYSLAFRAMSGVH
jgi:hypothetical protein